MKKLTLVIAMAIMSVNMTFAENGSLVRSAISQQLKIPSELKIQKFNELVNVQFKIDPNGKVSVLNVETSNVDLKNSIINQFNKINFKNINENKEIIYNISINFKVI